MLIVKTWSDKNSHSTRWDSYIVEVRFACILPGLSSLQTFWIYSRSSSIWEINDNNQSVLQFSEKHLIAFILKFIYSVLMTTKSSPKGNVLNSCLLTNWAIQVTGHSIRTDLCRFISSTQNFYQPVCQGLIWLSCSEAGGWHTQRGRSSRSSQQKNHIVAVRALHSPLSEMLKK